MKTLKLIAFISFFGATLNTNSQTETTQLYNSVNLLFGTTQLALDGFNVEGNLFFKRFVFDYSHGISLNFSNNQLEDGADKDQKLDIHIPWTTGFGVGYRFNNWLNLRVEPKLHKFELFQEGAEQNQLNLIGDYTTFTLGLGLYANLRPFKNQDNFLKGIMIAPNVRWWPKLYSSLSDDKLTYNNTITGGNETHQAREIGMANTPFFINMSIGYSHNF